MDTRIWAVAMACVASAECAPRSSMAGRTGHADSNRPTSVAGRAFVCPEVIARLRAYRPPRAVGRTVFCPEEAARWRDWSQPCRQLEAWQEFRRLLLLSIGWRLGLPWSSPRDADGGRFHAVVTMCNEGPQREGQAARCGRDMVRARQDDTVDALLRGSVIAATRGLYEHATGTVSNTECHESFWLNRDAWLCEALASLGQASEVMQRQLTTGETMRSSEELHHLAAYTDLMLRAVGMTHGVQMAHVPRSLETLACFSRPGSVYCAPDSRRALLPQALISNRFSSICSRADRTTIADLLLEVDQDGMASPYVYWR